MGNWGTRLRPLSRAGACSYAPITQTNKKRFEAQQMLVQLGALAHNITIWAKNWWLSDAPKLKHFGVLRLVRDLFTMSGFLVLDRSGRLEAIILNQADYLARRVVKALGALLVAEHVAVNLGKI
ncbi:MAG: hypothetical protein QNJ65_04575 [Xenococcaceae cyanobacterium MO_234.B1]|nr:hypothetical protein [Xenococcaceae cyanobacterium MO_234.B1]